MAPLDMYKEENTKCNLPAQVDISAVSGSSFEFLFIAKGGGSANKTFLFQQSKVCIIYIIYILYIYYIQYTKICCHTLAILIILLLLLLFCCCC